mgnify:CR=1 FL=1
MMKNSSDSLEALQEEISDLVEENKKLILENEKLKDEVESLWYLLDEIKKSDVKEHEHLLKQLEKDIALQSLMYTKKKGYA